MCVCVSTATHLFLTRGLWHPSQFAGAFHRGELYRPDEEPAKPAGPMVVHGKQAGAGAEDEIPAEVMRQLDDARRLVQVYRDQGKHDVADRVEEEVGFRRVGLGSRRRRGGDL